MTPTVLTRPSPGRETNGYRPIARPPFLAHLALDFGHGQGTEVHAAAAGWIQFDTTPGYGLRATVNHGRLIANSTITRYAHLQRPAPGLEAGQWVQQGQLIAVAGASGSFADAVHLHFELLLNFARTDPTAWFTTPVTNGAAEETAMPEYIHTDEDGVGYALIDSNYVDGVMVTADKTLATHFSYLTMGTPTKGAGQWYPRKDFNARCAAATAVWRANAAKAGAPVGDIAKVLQAIEAVPAAVVAAIKSIWVAPSR